jgi:lysophospholipase L1-like esterase
MDMGGTLAEAISGTSRIAWAGRVALCFFGVLAVLALVEIVLRRPAVASRVMTDVVDIRTPATLAAKVRYLSARSGNKIVLLGDSLVAGQTMRDYGDSNWRQNTMSADLQRRFDGIERNATTVMNLGMNGLLPADLETLVDGLLPTRPDVIVINVSLRSFSRDFAAPDAQHSRDWLKQGVRFRPEGTILRLPEQYGPGNALERLLLNRWTTYRLRDHMRARFIDGEPKDLLQQVRAAIEGKTGAPAAGPAAEMRLLLQVRSRYANASLDVENPQYAAWTRMLEKLKAANQKTVIFYGTESPRLLPGLIDQQRYAQLTEQLRRSVQSSGPSFLYIGPNSALPDEVFLDHVHVNAAGNRIYGENLFAAITLAKTAGQALGKPLDLVLTPFIETVSQEKTELGRLTDFSTSSSPADSPEKPRFDLKGFPVLSIETRGPEPHRDIMFLYHWWDKDGVPLGVRDSYHMLRASVVSRDEYPKALQTSLAASGHDREYVDVFAGIPVRAGATQTAFYLQDTGMRSSTTNLDNRSLAVFGHAIERRTLDAAAATVRSIGPSVNPFSISDVTTSIAFSESARTAISGRGVRIDLTGVTSVYTIRANHDLLVHSQPGEYLLGTMVPQVIGYKTEEDDHRTLYFSNTDLIRFQFDPGTKTLAIDAYDYEFRERSTRGSMSYPDADGARTHPNLGLVPKLPSQAISITNSRSAVMAFPLWQPDGRMAALAVTEHADYVGVPQDIVTMYGSGIPTVVEGQGFLGNRIPITKTIFPAGQPVPFKSRTASSETMGEFVQSTIEGDPNFIKSLRDFRSKGFDVEIGIHCVGTASNILERKTSFVRKAIAAIAEFKPVTWVDHGGRDCLWESGWDPTSEHYIVPVLRENKFKYVNMLGDKYDGRLNMIADNQPSNLLFYSVGLDDNLDDDWRPMVFNTVPIGFGKTEFTVEHLQQIVRARGLMNIHTYLPYESVMFELQPDGTSVLKPNPWYNQMLANIAAAAKSGDLHLATTEVLNDFILKARSLHVYAAGPEIRIRNPARHAIPGLTIGYRDMQPGNPGESIVRDADVKGKKTRDGVNYVWFDLKP